MIKSAYIIGISCIVLALRIPAAYSQTQAIKHSQDIRVDIAVYGATPSGISAAVAAARLGSKVALIEREAHIGGLMANGLCATDIKNRDSIGGLFLEFVTNVKKHYTDKYGPDSPQARDCNSGYFFEPHVAELLFEQMLQAQPDITVIKNSQLDKLIKRSGIIKEAVFIDRNGGPGVCVTAAQFIDATYEGDLAAMAGAPYRLGRESRAEYGEPYAGVIYWDYINQHYYEDLSTGAGDKRIQAYNYRLCLTNVPDNRILPGKPDNYNPREYRILARQERMGKIKTFKDIVHIVPMPNGKSDTNNHTIPLLSTDLPEENYDYPEANWEWRDKFAKRLRDYTLGLLYFCQNDYSLSDELRSDALRWGLAKDEYTDNGCFPRQMYVREARRIWGEYNFTAHDVMIEPGQSRPKLQPTSISCGSYEIDSHATRKYEPGIPVLEGLLGIRQSSFVYQTPYGVLVPKKVDNLLVSGAISGTHMGFSTLRMEPCWMAMGQAAGSAANIAIQDKTQPRKVDIDKLQRSLLKNNAVIMLFDDVTWDTPHREAIQFFGSRGAITSYQSRQRFAVDRGTAAMWLDMARRMDYWSKRPRQAGTDFVDLPQKHPASKAIGSLAERGIFQKESGLREFRPYEALTPEAMQAWFNAAEIKADISSYMSKPFITRGEFLDILYHLK